tara:strand:- start:284 stop:691 length:408 start_codon:yes stop_codon:yes gene_type:complete
MKKWNKKNSFSYFGVKQINDHWSWSAVSEDVTVLTLWVDQMKFDKLNRKYSHSNYNANNSIWKNLPGNRHRIDHINHCLDKHSGKFRAIITTPVKNNEFGETREIESLKPMKDLWFQIKSFDNETGEFESESISE